MPTFRIPSVLLLGFLTSTCLARSPPFASHSSNASHIATSSNPVDHGDLQREGESHEAELSVPRPILRPVLDRVAHSEEPGETSPRNSSDATFQATFNIPEKARRALGYSEDCEYEGKKYECTLGLTCWWRGKTPLDLCNGGIIWSCCVPPEDLQIIPEELDSVECGQIPMEGSKIIGGVEATFGDHPWQVGLIPKEYPDKVFCGGVLISKHFALTAAHCVALEDTEKRVIARLGEHDLDKASERYIHEDYEIRRVLRHEKYSKENFLYDIALLELALPVTFRKHIVPICLPEKGASFIGAMASVSGWGKSRLIAETFPSVLRKVDIQVIANEACSSWYGYFWRPIGNIHHTWLCAGFRMGGKDACQGDSGGPLVTVKDGRAQVIGLVSFGFGCALPLSPGIYTNVSNYVDWINERINPAWKPGITSSELRTIELEELSTASPIPSNEPGTVSTPIESELYHLE